jgi:Flp pilus assembly protein TadG
MTPRKLASPATLCANAQTAQTSKLPNLTTPGQLISFPFAHLANHPVQTCVDKGAAFCAALPDNKWFRKRK